MRGYAAYASRILAAPFEKKTKHYRGWPAELTNGVDTSVEIIRPTFLIIKALSDGFFLHYYSSKGDPLSDTWHRSLDDAKHQAEFEFGTFITEWREIPMDIPDPLDYVRGM